MDAREDILINLMKNLLKQNKPYTDIVELANSRDLLTNNPPYLSDESLHGPLAAHPLKVATKIMLELIENLEPEDEEYTNYRYFFEEHFSKAVKDAISKDVVQKGEDGQWQPVLSRLEALKSYAKGKGLKPSCVLMHFDRYEMKKKPDLLIQIPKWDEVDRIKQLGEFVRIKNQPFEIFEEALKEWGANIFRKLYHEVYQNRCIILKGDQGLGKDRLIKSLLASFGPYYSKFSCHRNENDCWSQVTSKLILHIEEFDQTGKMGIAFLKDMITRDWTTYRDPYAKRSLTRKCVGSFISTVNIDAFLRDETGNRRFAVFEIESIDWQYPKDWSDQVLAQFYHLYKTGWFAKPETWKAVAESNYHFEQVDITPELLDMWDKRVALLYGTNGPKETRGVKELTFGHVEGVISDLSKHCRWSMKALCSMLKVNKRSRKTSFGTVYWSNMINFATTDHSSDHMIDH